MKALALALALAAIGAPSPVWASAASELTERNRATMQDFAQTFYTARQPRAAMLKHVVPGYIQHNPAVANGREAAIGFLEKLFSAPGARFDVKRILVDGDLAAVHVHGRPDPSKPGVVAIDIYRLKDGKIVEHWDAVQPILPSAINANPF